MARWRYIGVLIAFILLLLFIILPPVGALTPLGMRTAGVLLFTIALWIFEPVPIGVTCFVTLALWVVVGALTFKDSFAYFGHYINLFLIGSFGIAGSLYSTGAARRYALSMLNLPFVRGRPWMFLIMWLFAASVLSSVTSNTATTVIFVALAIPVIEALGLKKGHTFAAMLLLLIGAAGSIGGNGTPIGTVVNVAGIGLVLNLFKYQMGFLQFSVAGYAVIFTCTILAYFVVRYILRPDVSPLAGVSTTYIQDELKKMGPMTLGEKLTWMFLGIAIFFWIIPDPMNYVIPSLYKALNAGQTMNWAVTALLIAFVMCLIPVSWKERKMLLNMRDWWAQTDIGVLSLVAVAMALGDLLPKAELGISASIQGMLGPGLAVLGLIGWLLIIALAMGALTNFMSNTATAVLGISVFAPLSATLGIGNPIAIAFACLMAASMAMWFPPGTTCTAIVFSTGYLSVPYGFKKGGILFIPLTLGACFVGYFVAAAVFPWPI